MMGIWSIEPFWQASDVDWDHAIRLLLLSFSWALACNLSILSSIVNGKGWETKLGNSQKPQWWRVRRDPPWPCPCPFNQTSLNSVLSSTKCVEAIEIKDNGVSYVIRGDCRKGEEGREGFVSWSPAASSCTCDFRSRAKDSLLCAHQVRFVSSNVLYFVDH